MISLKLDENLGRRAIQLAASAGFEVHGVRDENLSGATDDALFGRCSEEGRVLVTLDLDFSDPLRFPPAGRPGTVVLRPHRPSPVEIEALLRRAFDRLTMERIRGRIWIVEASRIRIYRDWDDEEDFDV